MRRNHGLKILYQSSRRVSSLIRRMLSRQTPPSQIRAVGIGHPGSRRGRLFRRNQRLLRLTASHTPEQRHRAVRARRRSRRRKLFGKADVLSGKILANLKIILRINPLNSEV